MKHFSIGVVTYVKRFEDFFKPLVAQLDRLFPDVHKTYVLNGFYDQQIQHQYLERAREFLAGKSRHSILSYNEHQSLSKCWNQAIIHSPEQQVLVLNDDVKLSWLFKQFLRVQVFRFEQATINGSWSHFVLNKNFVRQVGWFDERFEGVGFEDGDYVLRIAKRFGLSSVRLRGLHALHCPGLKNFIAPNDDPGWKGKSENYGNKYTQANFEFFQKKWETVDRPQPGFIHFVHAGYFRLRPGMETPRFYDFSVLDAPPGREKLP